MRMLDKFFNQHFQLYHRHVHMRLWHAHTARGGGAPGACPTASDRESDAAEQIQGFDPFAVLDYSASNEQAYDQYMNKHGVVSFITQSPLSAGQLVGRPAAELQAPPDAANAAGYFPEWVIAGDRFFETVNGGFFQNQAEWAHAWIDSQVELVPEQYSQQCYLAYADADPNAVAPGQYEAGVACGTYTDFRLLFTGIQIAGPHLDPKHLDQGFHAIPKVAGNDPQVPTCYFNPGDYTCIKDAEYMWWDP